MRKLIWGCLAGGFVLLAGIFTTATWAVRHPQSLVGQVVHDATQTASMINPLALLGASIVRLDRNDQPCCSTEGASEGPAEVCESPDTTSAPKTELAAAILIPDDEPIQAAAMPIGPPPGTLDPVQYHADGFLPGTECPPGVAAMAGPTVMPYCLDEEECEGHCKACPRKGGSHEESEQAPAHAEEECEPLHMPKIDDEEEQEDADGQHATGGAEKLLKMFEQMIKKDACPRETGDTEGSEPGTTPDCREDSHYHHHYSGCPYSGRSHPCCPPRNQCQPKEMTPPVVEPLPQPKPEGGEEAQEEGHTAMMRKIRQFRNRFSKEEMTPPHPEVDTMEYRPSDKQLYDYGPGPL